MSHERAHAEPLGEGLDGAKLVQREGLVPTFVELPGQVERLARVLPGLLAVCRQPTDLAEPCNPVGMLLQRAWADISPDRLLACVGWLSVAPSVALEQNPYNTLVCVTSEADCGQGDQTPGHEIWPALGKDRAPKSSGLIIRHYRQ